MKYLILPLLFASCAISPIYKSNTCFDLSPNVLIVEAVYEDNYFIAVRRKGLPRAILSGLVPHKTLERNIEGDELQMVNCREKLGAIL
jgi:hypothetical protein